MLHVYLPYFCVLLDFVVCGVAVWAPHIDTVNGCRRGRLGLAVVVVSMCPIWADATLAEGVLEGEVAVTATLRSDLSL